MALDELGKGIPEAMPQESEKRALSKPGSNTECAEQEAAPTGEAGISCGEVAVAVSPTVPPGMVSHSVLLALAMQHEGSDTSSVSSSSGENPWGLIRAAASPAASPGVRSAQSDEDHQPRKGTNRKLKKVPTLSSEGQRQTLMKMSSLSLTSPNLLRATYAKEPLRWFGSVFREHAPPVPGSEARLGYGRRRHERDAEEESTHSQGSRASRAPVSTFELSFPTDNIDHFWTHSWSGNPVLKTLVLMLQYNLLAASIASTIAALIAMLLCVHGVLPPMAATTSRHAVPSVVLTALGRYNTGEDFQAHAFWPLLAGTSTFVLVLLQWRSRKLIFLDKVCIEQCDQQRKQQGVECIGAFLSYSRKILVLWDPSYATRLWCVFEMAAFAWAHDRHIADRVIVRPLLFGAVFPCLMATSIFSQCFLIFLPLESLLATLSGSSVISAVVSMLLCTHLLRHLGRDIVRMGELLKEYMVAKANCYCCSIEHRDPETGTKISCDRQVIQACIIAWFGSLKEFEEFVQSDLAPRFRSSLGRVGVPYWWVVASQMPDLWCHLDLAIPYLRAGQWQLAASSLLAGLFAWLCVRPLAICILIRMSCMFSARRKSRIADAGVTLFVCLVATTINVVFQGPFFLVTWLHPLWGPYVCASVALVVCIAVYRCN